MPIVSSTYQPDAHTQVDGRRYVTESHTDATGAVHTLTYLADPGADYGAILAVHAQQLAQQMADAEYQSIVEATP